MTAPIAATDFKSYFDRDFIYGTDMTTVRDVDINNAISRANMFFNDSLWNSSDDIQSAFLLLTAHFLVRALDAGGGLNLLGAGSRSTGSGPVTQKSAGGMNVSYSLPAELIENPMLNDLMTTGYGKLYLQLVVPNLIGNFGTAYGRTNP